MNEKIDIRRSESFSTKPESGWDLEKNYGIEQYDFSVTGLHDYASVQEWRKFLPLAEKLKELDTDRFNLIVREKIDQKNGDEAWLSAINSHFGGKLSNHDWLSVLQLIQSAKALELSVEWKKAVDSSGGVMREIIASLKNQLPILRLDPNIDILESLICLNDVWTAIYSDGFRLDIPWKTLSDIALERWNEPIGMEVAAFVLRLAPWHFKAQIEPRLTDRHILLLEGIRNTVHQSQNNPEGIDHLGDVELGCAAKHILEYLAKSNVAKGPEPHALPDMRNY